MTFEKKSITLDSTIINKAMLVLQNIDKYRNFSHLVHVALKELVERENVREMVEEDKDKVDYIETVFAQEQGGNNS
jgi:hypothetical protein